ncbi:secreted protein [Murinocardiopsis flavida]|uniref:Cytochrome bc1 complex Rieske iron-sulfur subunit n=1 Tax=Murinocardiopsis flavida TaxID=645275 RepID=A0A2P8D3L6_9ACTN|nr:Rieske (2Fe-2S) protein [Murinocardiopsis flavida]PSK91786.1 secreted protein [Murinocardiopsis flavida]
MREPTGTGVTRRRVLGAAGAAGAAAVGAAACATPEEDRPTPHDKLHGTVVAQTGDVPEGGGTVIVKSKLVLTQPAKGDYKAFSAVCAHAGCTIQEVKENIHCLCHGSEFDLATGDVLEGPANKPLEPLDVTVEGTDITLV